MLEHCVVVQMHPLVFAFIRSFYELPLIFLQLRVSYVLFVERKAFHSTFYRFIIFNNTTTIFLWCCIQFVHNYPAWRTILYFLPPLEDYQFWTSFVVYSMHSFELTWLSCCLFMAINRLSAIALGYEKEHLWHKLFYLIVILSVVAPRVMFYPLSSELSKFVIKNRFFVPLYFVKYMDFEQQVHSVYQVGKTSIVEAFYLIAILSTLIPLVIFHKLHYQKSEEKIARPDRKWLWTLLVDLVLHLAWSLHDILLFFVEDQQWRSAIIMTFVVAREVLPIMYGFVVVGLDAKLHKAVFKPFEPKQQTALFQIK